MGENMIEQHEKILRKISNLLVEAGVSYSNNWRSYGINDTIKKENYLLSVDYDVPEYLYTEDGYYVIGGMSYSGNALEIFWELMYKNFDITEIKPKRDDSKISELEFQLCLSGPLLKLVDKT